MVKYKIQFNGVLNVIKAKLSKKAVLNENDIGIIYGCPVKGLIRPIMRNKKKLEYMCNATTTLNGFLRSGTTVRAFFSFVAQLVQVLKFMEKSGLNMNNLVLDGDYVFVDAKTGEIYLLYEPLVFNSRQVNVYSFIINCANITSLNYAESKMYINNLVKNIYEQPVYSTAALEDIVNSYYNSQNKNYSDESYEHYATSNAISYSSEKQYSANTQYGTNTYENNASAYVQQNRHIDVYNNYDDASATNLLFEVCSDNNTASVMTGPAARSNEMQTTVLDFRNEVIRPHMIRLISFETVYINSSHFTIGKDNGASYTITNNSAISRIHAEIISECGHYYIRDNKSTNHTFLNKKMLAPGEQVEISDGDTFMLANEKFEFHIN